MLSSTVIYQRSYYLLDRKRSFELWKDYNRINQQNCSIFKNQILSIKYEDLLTKPVLYLENIFSFIEVIPGKNEINNIASNIDSSRAYSFVDNLELVDFYNEIKNDKMVSLMGYSNII